MPSFDYTSRDYLSIKQDILSRAVEALPEWTSRQTSDFGMIMVDLWAYIGDILHYYVDRAAAETYVGTAVNTESVFALANLFDYRPAHKTSATGTVIVSTTNPTHVDTVFIPINTGFLAPSSDNLPAVYYTSTASASMGPSVQSVVVPVAEGKHVSNESPIHSVTGNTYSNGTAGQRFNLRFKEAVVSSVSVTVAEGTSVGGVPTAISYTYTSDLSTAPSDSRVFTVEFASDGVGQIVFGNGFNGKIPLNLAEVKVSYRRGQGSGGNIPAGRVTSFDSGSQVANTIISSSSAMSGGTNSESLESMKINIPLMFRTQDRAVSLQDFKDLALRVPQVVKATCIATNSNVTVHPLPYQYDYVNTTSASVSVPETVKNDVIAYFEPRKVIGASVSVANSVTLTPLNITATVQVKENYVAYWVKESVTETINNFFEFEKVSFGQTLSLGEIYRAIQSIDGVDYVTISVFSTGSSGTSSTITADPASLFRKGNVNISTSGGITGLSV